MSSAATLREEDCRFEDESAATSAWSEDVRARALRAAHAPDPPLPLRRRAWLLAIALHVIVIVGLRLALRAPPSPAVDTTISIQLMDGPYAEPALPEPAPQTAAKSVPRQRPPARVPSSVANTPQSTEPPLPAPEAVLRIFNLDGSASIPDDMAAQIDRAQPRANFVPKRFEPSPLLEDKRPLKVRPNHFAQYWDGTDGKPLHETIWRYVTAEKEFTAPWGGRYRCVWILMIGGCADIPDKPWTPPTTWKPATELDER